MDRRFLVAVVALAFVFGFGVKNLYCEKDYPVGDDDMVQTPLAEKPVPAEDRKGADDSKPFEAPAPVQTFTNEGQAAPVEPGAPAEGVPAVTPVPESNMPAAEPATDKPADKMKTEESTAAVQPAPESAPVPAPAENVEKTEAASVPAAPADVKKEEAKPEEKAKKSAAHKEPRMADLVIKSVVAKPSGDNEVEVWVHIKNIGKVSANPTEKTGAIKLAVRPAGELSTREMKIDGGIAAGKKKEVLVGKYPKDKIEGKNIFVMINYASKEAGKGNNVWDKPAQMPKAAKRSGKKS